MEGLFSTGPTPSCFELLHDENLFYGARTGDYPKSQSLLYLNENQNIQVKLYIDITAMAILAWPF